jgi:iron(III) transport system ATP-binding protein
MRAYLEVEHLRKAFDGGEVAVDDISFGVERGQILTLLGPSGCGKTTTLRCIAGLETPTGGSIQLDGETVTSVEAGRHVPAERRNIGMVFQSYAVWPHMTVRQNLELPLEVRKVPPDQRRRRVGQVLELVGLSGLEDRYATRLSGGQQQRVALARALIYNPRLLLFDEPLSNLDAKLRERMRFEIRKLQREVGITSVYVTHDQAEAMIISDRIIVMNRGRIEQEGDARTLYTRPASAFVATFLGVANLARGHLLAERSGPEDVCVQVQVGQHTFSARAVSSLPSGGEVYLSIRPEDIRLRGGSLDLQGDALSVNVDSNLCGTVETVNYLGNFVEYVVQAAGQEWRVQAHPQDTFQVGDTVSLELPAERCLCLPV